MQALTAQDDLSHTAEDASLVQRVLQGHVDAYGLLYDRYAGLVRAVCYDATRDLHRAQDLAQEVFLRGYRQLSKLDDPAHFAAWLLGITRVVCLEWQRQSRHDRRVFHESLADAPAAASATEPRDEWDQIQLQIAQLKPIERTALHLFYLQENSVDDARRILNLSRSGFYRVLERAMKRLRRGMHRSEEKQ